MSPQKTLVMSPSIISGLSQHWLCHHQSSLVCHKTSYVNTKHQLCHRQSSPVCHNTGYVTTKHWLCHHQSSPVCRSTGYVTIVSTVCHSTGYVTINRLHSLSQHLLFFMSVNDLKAFIWLILHWYTHSQHNIHTYAHTTHHAHTHHTPYTHT